MTDVSLKASMTLETASVTAGVGRVRRDLNNLQGSTNNFTKGAGNNLNNFSKSVNNSTRSLSSLGGVLAGIVSVGAFVALGRNALNAADQIAKMSDRLGLTTDQFQKYEYAAKLAGVSTEQLETAFGFLNRQIAEGKLPYGDINSALEDLAERTKNAKDGIERARIATEAFGARGGARLIPFLVQGKEGIAALGAEAEKLGIVLNSDTIRATEQFKDQLEILGTVVSRNFQQGFLDGFVKQSGNIRDIYSDPIFIQSLQDIGAAFGAIASGILSIVKVYGQAQIVIGSLAAGLAFDVGAIDKDVLDEALKDARSRLAGEGSLSEIPVNIVAKEESASVARQTNQKQELDYVKKRQDAANGILTSLNQEIDLAQIKIDMNGQNAAAIESAIRKQRLYYQLESQGVTLTKEQNENIREKLALLEETQIQLKEIEEQNKLIEQAESDRQQAMTQLAYTFESAFESAITSGKDLGDVINSLIKDIATLILRTQVTAPLMQNLFGTGGGSGGGGLGGIFGSALGSIFGGAGSPGGAPVTTAGALPWLSIPSFATGTDYVTRDTMAMVHRGEAIIPASELNKMNQSSASVNVTQNINVSPGVPELINQKIRESAPIIKQAAMDGVFNEINRGGAAAKTSGRR